MQKLYPVCDKISAAEAKELGFSKTPQQSITIDGIVQRGVHAVTTGEKRTPLKGEWYLSGAIPEAYKAQGRMTGNYHICKLVRVAKV